MVIGSPSFGRLRLPARAGTTQASQVLWCLSSHMPRSFPTPADPRQPHLNGCFVLASALAKTIAVCFFASLTRLFHASGSAVSLMAYVIPCVRLNRYVRAFVSPSSRLQHSVRVVG